VLARELFAWRKFNNRRELAGSVGLGSSPYRSGSLEHDQGISKAGNARVRTLMVELAWSWLRYQAQSALAKWYFERFGRASGRSRRIGIVALARRLLIALWRFVEHGVIPEGAKLKAA
jgi:transposase